MKYIQLFESYLNKFYFKNPEKSPTETIDMSQENYEKILVLFKNLVEEKIATLEWIPCPTPEIDPENDEEIYLDAVDIRLERRDINRYYSILINELRDDWFTVEIFTYQSKDSMLPLKMFPTDEGPAVWRGRSYLPEESAFYLCDGFEGLVKLIDDLGFLKFNKENLSEIDRKKHLKRKVK